MLVQRVDIAATLRQQQSERNTTLLQGRHCEVPTAGLRRAMLDWEGKPMLVLSRSESEAIRLKNLDVIVKVLKLQGNRVRLGIEAPPHIEIVRDELDAQVQHTKSKSKQTQAVELTLTIRDMLTTGLITEASKATDQLAARLNQLENASADEQADLLKQFGNAAQVTKVDDPQNPDALPNAQAGMETLRGLIVDDNENENRLLAGYLRLEKFAIETAAHGRDAIGMMQQRDFDFVLLDMQMPEYDGSWTLEKIRGDDSLKDTQVLVVSGHPSSHYGISVSPGGCNAWFEKPIDPRTIVKHIRDLLLASPA